MQSGIVAGYEVVDVKVTLIDGSFHEVDSSEMAFKICGSMAFKEACQKAGATLLEPIMKVVVTAPENYMGDVMGDINARRGQISGSDIRNGAAIVTAEKGGAAMRNRASELGIDVFDLDDLNNMLNKHFDKRLRNLIRVAD